MSHATSRRRPGPRSSAVGGDCGDLCRRGRRDRRPDPRWRIRRRRRDPDRPPRRCDGAVHGGLGRALGHLPARLRRGSRRSVPPRRAGSCWRSTCPLPSRGRRSQVSTGSRSRSRSRPRVAFAWMLTLLHAARSTTGRLALAVAVVAGCALVGFVPAGALLGPAGAVAGRARAVGGRARCCSPRRPSDRVALPAGARMTPSVVAVVLGWR